MEKQKLVWDPENFDIVWEIDPKYLPLGFPFPLSQRSEVLSLIVLLGRSGKECWLLGR